MEDKQGVGAKSEEAGAKDEQGQPEAASKCFEAAWCLFCERNMIHYDQRPRNVLFYKNSGGPILCGGLQMMLPPVLENYIPHNLQHYYQDLPVIGKKWQLKLLHFWQAIGVKIHIL